MSGTLVYSSWLAPQSGGFFNWIWPSVPGGNRVQSTASAPSMGRWLSSSSNSSSSSAESKSSSDVYSRSSSASSQTCSEDGLKDYVPDEPEMRIVFERFDENKDGLICAKDLHRFMARFGVEMSEEDAKSMLKSVDKNADGRVDFDEFFSLYLSLSDDIHGAAKNGDAAQEEEDTLEHVFKVFDINGDGHITSRELQKVLIKLEIPEARSIRNCEQMIQRVDSNGDKKIDISEFKAMMCSDFFQNLC